jgi:hypothetical protein
VSRGGKVHSELHIDIVQKREKQHELKHKNAKIILVQLQICKIVRRVVQKK